MQKYFSVLRNCQLFNRIEDKDFNKILNCLDAKKKSYSKGDMILSEGDTAKYFGIILNGKVQIERVDYYGTRSILTSIEESQLFGESFACAGIKSMPVNVIAAENTEILLIDAKRISQSCSKSCSFHNQLIFNLLNIVAKKNLVFHEKIEITSKRTTREKLMTYLLLQEKKHNSNSFTIPYDRQELADYLEVERSGLCTEISKLRKEKRIKCTRSKFT